MAWKLTMVAMLAFAGTALAGPIAGTAEPDVLKGTAGDDTLRGRGGDDELAGRKGDDILIGGPGADAMAGGRGEDRCATDAADPMPTSCEDVSGPAGPLRMEHTTGTDRCLVLRRADLCYFLLEGAGADAAGGTIVASGDVRLTSDPGAVEARDGAWTANGTYGCDGDGELAVTIATETVSAPVDCTGA